MLLIVLLNGLLGAIFGLRFRVQIVIPLIVVAIAEVVYSQPDWTVVVAILVSDRTDLFGRNWLSDWGISKRTLAVLRPRKCSSRMHEA